MEKSPVSLHYVDPRPFSVDVDSIIQRGVRVRRRRKAVLAATACIMSVSGLCAAVYPQLFTGRGDGQENVGSEVISNDAKIALLPAMKGWTPAAWVTVDGNICTGVVGGSPTNVTRTCGEWDLPIRDPSKLMFIGTPDPADVDYHALAIGLAPAADADQTVAVTFHGRTYMAKCRLIARGVAAYAVWFDIMGLSNYGDGDVTAITVRP